MRFKLDRLLPVPMAATRDGRYRSFGGGNEKPPPLICELPLTSSCRSSYIEDLAFCCALTSIERMIEPEANV
jgi:hypothetical protein